MIGTLGPSPKIRPGGNAVIYSEHWLTLEHLKVIWSWGEWGNTVSTLPPGFISSGIFHFIYLSLIFKLAL